MFRKALYPYEYMDEWEKVKETSLPKKETLHSNLNMKDITDRDYTHRKRVCENVKIKSLEYHDLHAQSDILLLADIFENFRKMSLETYELDSAHNLTMNWQIALGKSKVNLCLLPDIEIILMVVKCIRRGICYTIHQYAKINSKYMKDYDKSKVTKVTCKWF